MVTLNRKTEKYMSDYNGWTNRETWLVNLWFIDGLDSEEETTAEYLREMVEEYVDSIVPASGFVADMINLSCINWTELAESHNDK